MMLAVPRSIAALEAVPALRALAKVSGAKKASISELRDGTEGLRRAVSWVSSGRRLVSLGTLEFLLAQETPLTDPSRAGLLELSERYLTEGLAAHPYDGTGWFRLAQVRQSRGAAGRSVVTALLQSLDMAPSSRSLWFARAVGLLVYGWYLTPDEMEAVKSQFRTYWRSVVPQDRLNLVLAGKATGRLDMILAALQDDIEALQQFEKFRTALSPNATQTK